MSQEHEEEEESESSEEHPFPLPKEQEDLIWAGLRETFPPGTVGKLLQMAAKKVKKESPIFSALKEVCPNFKGDFVNFALKEASFNEIMTTLPEIPEGFVFVDIQPLKKPAAKDAQEVRAADLALTEVAKTLQAALRCFLAALDAAPETCDYVCSEGLFRGICLAANALGALQVERHTTAMLRAKISEETPGSEVPVIVQKVKKRSFFRTEAGGRRHPSSNSESSDDGEAEEPMRKKKRDYFRGSKRIFSPGARRRKRSRPGAFGGGRFYSPKPKWKRSKKDIQKELQQRMQQFPQEGDPP
jgi:hypothetical protein